MGVSQKQVSTWRETLKIVKEAKAAQDAQDEADELRAIQEIREPEHIVLAVLGFLGSEAWEVGREIIEVSGENIDFNHLGGTYLYLTPDGFLEATRSSLEPQPVDVRLIESLLASSGFKSSQGLLGYIAEEIERRANRIQLEASEALAILKERQSS